MQDFFYIVQKKDRLKDDLIFQVTRPGFEPRLTVPKTAVLPLHHQAIKAANIECDLKINKLLL